MTVSSPCKLQRGLRLWRKRVKGVVSCGSRFCIAESWLKAVVSCGARLCIALLPSSGTFRGHALGPIQYRKGRIYRLAATCIRGPAVSLVVVPHSKLVSRKHLDKKNVLEKYETYWLSEPQLMNVPINLLLRCFKAECDKRKLNEKATMFRFLRSGKGGIFFPFFSKRKI